jgi:hypothetical protein
VSLPPTLENLALASLYNDDFDTIRAASAVQLQLDPGTTTAAPEPSTQADPSSAEPAPAASRDISTCLHALAEMESRLTRLK